MRATTGGHAHQSAKQRQRAQARHLIDLYEHADRNRGGGKRPGLGTVVSAVQGGLEGLGLSGAAHPVRRLQHPGGLMMLPTLGGRGGGLVQGTASRGSLLRAAERAAAGAPEGKAAQVGRLGRVGAAIDERQRLVNARRAHPVGRWQKARYWEPGDVNLSAIPYLALLGYVAYDELKPKGRKPKRPDHSERDRKAARDEYQTVLDHLVHTDQITLAQSVRADEWSGRQSAPVLRARSRELRRKYRLPKLSK